jgi:CBS domain containing-hemolysin-like protein
LISKQKTNLFLRISIAVLILGILFKILHLNYTAIVFISGAIGIIVFYTVRFFQKQPKELLDYSKLFLVIAFVIQYVLQVFHWSFGGIFQRIAQIAFVIFMILYVRDVFFLKDEGEEFKDSESRKKATNKKLNYFLYGIAGLGIIVGAQFKILHWEFGFITGDILLSIGLLAAVISVIRGFGDD